MANQNRNKMKLTGAKYGEWFYGLFTGTTYRDRKECIANTAEHTLIRVKGHNYWSGNGNRYGGTEWYLAVNGEYESNSYKAPVAVWKKDGRLLKEDKQYLLKEYGIEYGRITEDPHP